MLNTDPQYSKYGNGSRTRKTVESFLYRERHKTEEIVKIAIPIHVIREAREKGITETQLHFFALRAILQRVKTAG